MPHQAIKSWAEDHPAEQGQVFCRYIADAAVESLVEKRTASVSSISEQAEEKKNKRKGQEEYREQIGARGYESIKVGPSRFGMTLGKAIELEPQTPAEPPDQ